MRPNISSDSVADNQKNVVLTRLEKKADSQRTEKWRGVEVRLHEGHIASASWRLQLGVYWWQLREECSISKRHECLRSALRRGKLLRSPIHKIPARFSSSGDETVATVPGGNL